MDTKVLSAAEQRELHIAIGRTIYEACRRRSLGSGLVEWGKLPSDKRMAWREVASEVVKVLAKLPVTGG